MWIISHNILIFHAKTGTIILRKSTKEADFETEDLQI